MDDRFDPELILSGDTRNVIDKYRNWTIEAIREDLTKTRSSFHVAIENWEHDLNIGAIVRTANAFNVGGVHIIGRKHWNRRGAMVTDRYVDVFHHPDVGSFVSSVQGYEIIAVDNLEGSVPLGITALPPVCILMFGSEHAGLSSEAIEAASMMIRIEQFGSTRSINAASAAAIAMYEWVRQNRL